MTGLRIMEIGFRLVAGLLLFVACPAGAQDTVFLHVNVVPMDRERVLRDQTIVVRDGRIAGIGKTASVPKGAQVIDGEGRLWVTPGLADMHVHSDTSDDLAVYLAHGITTIANMGRARSMFVGLISRASSTGSIAGPRVFNAFVIDGSPDFGHFIVTTPEEARAAVGLAKTNGYSFIKVYNNLDADVFAAAAEEAKRLGLPIVGHGVTKVGLESQIAQGQALVAHSEEFFYTFFSPPGAEQTDTPPQDSRIPDAIALVRRHGTAVTADLISFGSIMRAIGRQDRVDVCLVSPSADFVSPADRLEWRRSRYFSKTADLRAKYAFLQRMLKAMADANVDLLAGTDAPTIPCVGPGVSLHDNLAELEAAGLTRFQALSTATRIPGDFIARKLGGPRFGVIELGARADLVISTSNPLDDPATLREPVGVMVDGRWHDSAALRTLRDGVKDSYGRPRQHDPILPQGVEPSLNTPSEGRRETKPAHNPAATGGSWNSFRNPKKKEERRDAV